MPDIRTWVRTVVLLYLHTYLLKLLAITVVIFGRIVTLARFAFMQNASDTFYKFCVQ